jgi:hypothetical protein
MMTTMAALMGTLPSPWALGAGAEVRQPLGLAVVGGLLLSQFLTLYLTPVVYLYLDRFAKPLAEPGIVLIRRSHRCPMQAAKVRQQLDSLAGDSSQMKKILSRSALVVLTVLTLALGACSKEPDDAGGSAEKPDAAAVDDVPTAASPLARAVTRGDLAKIRTLLDSGAEVDATDALGRTPAAHGGLLRTHPGH